MAKKFKKFIFKLKFRVSFVDLYSRYEKLLPPNLANLDPRMFCKVTKLIILTFNKK